MKEEVYGSHIVTSTFGSFGIVAPNANEENIISYLDISCILQTHESKCLNNPVHTISQTKHPKSNSQFCYAITPSSSLPVMCHTSTQLPTTHTQI